MGNKGKSSNTHTHKVLKRRTHWRTSVLGFGSPAKDSTHFPPVRMLKTNRAHGRYMAYAPGIWGGKQRPINAQAT